MSSLEQYGLYSGYKLNVHKTQTLSYNFFPQENVRKRYNFKWKTNIIKYLGVNIQRNLTDIYNKLSPYHERNKNRLG